MMAVMMAASFIPEHLRDYMGDWQCDGSGKSIGYEGYEKCNYAASAYHDPTWHWGWRHWLFQLFGLVFCIINVIRIVLNWEEKK